MSAKEAIDRLRGGNEWKFFAVLARADAPLTIAWWTLLVTRSLLPTFFAIAMGGVVGAVTRGDGLLGPLVFIGTVVMLYQILPPITQVCGLSLAMRTSAWLHDRLMDACLQPPGVAHLEDPTLTTDVTVARDFDLGLAGPPLAVSMGFIAAGLGELIAGVALAVVLVKFHWWAALLLGGVWIATHWLMRGSGAWRGRTSPAVRQAQRDADYAYRLAVDAPAAKELRLFGLADWIVDRFHTNRQQLCDLRWEATRLRQRPIVWSLLLVVTANVTVYWSLGAAALAGGLSLGALATFASATAGTSLIAFGGLSWTLDGAAAPAAAVLRLEDAMARRGALSLGSDPAMGAPTREIRFRDVTFAYPTGGAPVLDGFNLTIPAGSSMAIVGLNGAGKTTIAKLLCRLYDPQQGAIEIDGVDLRRLDFDGWRARLAAVFQDFVRFEWPLRDNVAPRGASDETIAAALAAAGATGLADVETVLARGYKGGVELSGGQWQRVAIARALCAVRQGAGVVLLDEPTAQLDVRGEAEIFGRVLAETRSATTILISHRFSTVRHADRICVLEAGKVVEIGSHAELMALGGRYRTMFDLQAAPFGDHTSGDVPDAPV